jgi:hypothetical protein
MKRRKWVLVETASFSQRASTEAADISLAGDHDSRERLAKAA